MTNPKKHPHTEFIKEYLEDTSRVIEGENKQVGQNFHKTSIDMVLKCDGSWKFRFADTVDTEEHEIVSSFTDDELLALYNCWDTNDAFLRCIADAVAVRATMDERKRICTLPYITSLSDAQLEDIYYNYGNNLQVYVNTAIHTFQAAVLEGII